MHLVVRWKFLELLVLFLFPPTPKDNLDPAFQFQISQDLIRKFALECQMRRRPVVRSRWFILANRSQQSPPQLGNIIHNLSIFDLCEKFEYLWSKV